MDEYLALLDKARAQLPEIRASGERWSVPPAELISEGRMTVLRNFRDIVNEVRRDEMHVAKYILQAIGTAGQVDGDRLIMTGRIEQSQVDGRIHDYVATYVRCAECGAPDTHLEKDGRVQVLKCDACGAHSPVKARKGAARLKDEVRVREGNVIEVTITVEGSRGEGKVPVEGYTVIVPKTPAGTTLKARITRISGKIAFAERVE
jgi:translation initiation factor 2 subunit 2